MPEYATPKYASAMAFERITRHPTIMAGVPCIKGTRLPVATVVAYVALIRGAGTDLDHAAYGVLGDTVLGDPLFVAGLVAGLWMVLRPWDTQRATGVPPPDAAWEAFAKPQSTR